jgi:hypothetical protein
MNYMFKESEQRDSNPRPSGPKPDALAKLRYAPTYPLYYQRRLFGPIFSFRIVRKNGIMLFF